MISNFGPYGLVIRRVFFKKTLLKTIKRLFCPKGMPEKYDFKCFYRNARFRVFNYQTDQRFNYYTNISKTKNVAKYHDFYCDFFIPFKIQQQKLLSARWCFWVEYLEYIMIISVAWWQSMQWSWTRQTVQMPPPPSPIQQLPTRMLPPPNTQQNLTGERRIKPSAPHPCARSFSKLLTETWTRSQHCSAKTWERKQLEWTRRHLGWWSDQASNVQLKQRRFKGRRENIVARTTLLLFNVTMHRTVVSFDELWITSNTFD